MNFKGHVVSGLVTSSVTSGVVYFTQPTSQLNMPINEVCVLTFLCCWFYSLFPDFDIASVPQRWYYRFSFLTFLLLLYDGYYEFGCVLGLINSVPLLHKHRGLTHWISFSLIFPMVIFCVIEYYVLKNKDMSYNFICEKYWVLYIASVIGWWTHLWADGVKKNG